MDEFYSPSFSSVEPDLPFSLSPRNSLSIIGIDPEEDRSMFEQMCRSYEDLRMQALDQRVPESDFVARLGLSAPCFLDNPDLFTDVHRIWCDDYNRALMYRVDPFKTTLELLRSNLNPAIPSELRKRRELQRTILGPLKSPQVVLGASPFDTPRSSSLWKRREKTSLKKLQAAYNASQSQSVSNKRGGSLSLAHVLLPSPSIQRKLDHTQHKRPTVIIDGDSSVSNCIVSLRSHPSASSTTSTTTIGASPKNNNTNNNNNNNSSFTLGDLLSSSRKESPRSLSRLKSFFGKSK